MNNKIIKELTGWYGVTAIIALILNIVWEFSHYFLYIDSSGIAKYPHLLIASLADMVIICIIYGTISAKNKGLNWMQNPRAIDYFLIIFFGLAIAFVNEKINLDLGRWSYTNMMPTVFHIGLSPLIQLALTGALSLKIINYIDKNSHA